MTITEKARNLFSNEYFQELILKGFIHDGILEISLRDGVNNEGARDEIKARKILNDYLNYLLDYDNINQINKGAIDG